MKFPIGAMTVGDILDRGLKVLLARVGIFYLINLIVLSPVIVYQLTIPALVMAAPGTSPGAALGGLLVGGLVVLILLLILQPIGTAAILHVIAQEFIDQRVGLGAAFGFALGRFGKLLWASIVSGLMIGFGFLLCLVPGIIFWSWYALVAQVVVVEGLGAEKALNRSKKLTEGFRGRVLGLLLLFILISIIVQAGVGLLDYVLPSHEFVPSGGPEQRGLFQGPAVTPVLNYTNYAIQALIGQLVSILVQTLQAVCFTLLYFDLRIRKEGFDLELAARQQIPTTQWPSRTPDTAGGER